MEEVTFKFKGKLYAFTDKWEETCLNDSKQFQLEQFNYLIQTKDFTALENRIINQKKFGYLKQI
tara:strand:+ start:378 stop:569 length:192 start_codon:yes stop_codon:yes gene_type:complete